MEVKLSVLIATMPSRDVQLNELLSCLHKQGAFNIRSTVECIYDPSMDYNIGTKRNKLLKEARGEYITFIDDDDHISDSYISLVLDACKSGADCIGINGIITTDGANERKWYISKEFGSWYTENGKYYRTPNHISPVKRELALKAGFPEISFAEDAEYSRRLLPLLKTETIITQPIYHYDYYEHKKY